MSTLILSLPLSTGSAPEYEFVQLSDDLQPTAQGRAGAALLPAIQARNTALVAVLPARALSWHTVSVPHRVRAALLGGRMELARRRAVLTGLLEEVLLDDAEQLHFAVFAGLADTLWVAACDRHWLAQVLHPLEAAGYAVTRLVAECEPRAEAPWQVVLCAGLEPAQMVFSGMHGVSVLPLSPAALAYARAQGTVEFFAEPALLALSEQMTGAPVALQTATQRAQRAAQSAWNLAQGEFSHSQGGRWRKRAVEAWQQWMHAPGWRPMRWGVLALVLVQILALNVLAWKQRAQWAQRRAEVQSILTQTFPDVQVVVDAPLQMRRAVDALALARGESPGPEVGRVLTALAPLAADLSVTGLDVNGSSLRLQTTGLTDTTAPAVLTGLASQGMAAQWTNGQINIEFSGAQP
jgi:general secretion pathway protein L